MLDFRYSFAYSQRRGFLFLHLMMQLITDLIPARSDQRLSAPLRKYLASAVLMIVLYRRAAAILPLFCLGIVSSAVFSGFAPPVRAEDAGPVPTESSQLTSVPTPTTETSAEPSPPATAPTVTIAPGPTSQQPAGGQLLPEVPKIPGEGEKLTGFVDKLHGELSKQIVDTATWMDSFFADESYVKEENHSYVKFRYDVFQEERAKMTMNPAVDLRLGLPELERKTHLVLSAEPAQPADNVNTPVQTAGERFGQSQQRNLTTAIHYFFRSTAQESFLVRTGIQFSKLSPVILFEPRYRVLFPLNAWNLRFTQDVLWRSRSSWTTDTRFDFERLLPHAFFFRTTIDGVWAAQVTGYTYSLSFSLQQPLAPTHAIDYVWINNYQTSPVGELTEVDFQVRYRHNFWRKWLFFEIAPQVRYPRAMNFDVLPGILFRIEMFFGGY